MSGSDDSLSTLPAQSCAEWGIRVVPLHVLVDGRDLRDGLDEMPSDLYQRAQVSTAGAGPAELTDPAPTRRFQPAHLQPTKA